MLMQLSLKQYISDLKIVISRQVIYPYNLVFDPLGSSIPSLEERDFLGLTMSCNFVAF
jgi:hypothetical protein